MKVFIAGGTGFLGKHVVPKFDGHDVYAPHSKQVNLISYHETKQYLGWFKPDAILHMAALCGGLYKNKKSPADFLSINTQIGLNVYKVAQELNIKSVHSLGSVCMYPVNCPLPFKENDIYNGFPEITNSPYGISKRTLLLLSQTYREQYGIKGTFLIPVNMFGEMDCFDLENSHVIPALIRKFVYAVDNNLDSVECWGDENGASREFLYAGDAAEIISKVVLENKDIADPINLGTGQEITIKNLAFLIKELTNFQGNIIFNGKVGNGQPRRCLDVSKAKKILNWQASTSLKEGLVKTINWYQENKSEINK